MRKRALVLASAWIWIWICAAAAPPVLGQEEGARLAGLLRDVSPAIVTVKVVTNITVKQSAKSADHESRVELPGVVVDASGLIMTSIVPFAPEWLLKRFTRGEDLAKLQVTTVPSEIKICFEQEEKENGAFLAATDSNLGVAFLQLEDLAGKQIKAVDFSRPGAGPAVGDLVAGVSRLGKGYDAAPYFQTARISGKIGKPRQAWVTDGEVTMLGLPVFSPAGQVLGIVSMVGPGLGDADASANDPFSRGLSMMTGGGGGFRAFILPAPAVAAVIEQARQQAAQKAAERAAQKAAPKPASKD